MKFCTVVLCLLIAACLFGCGNQRNLPDEYDVKFLDGVSMKTVEPQYSAGVEKIDVVWENNTDNDLTFGEYFHIEKYISGKWVKAYDKDPVFTAIGLLVAPNSQREHTYNLKIYTDSIEAGNYRIMTRYSTVKSSGDYVEYFLYVDLIIN